MIGHGDDVEATRVRGDDEFFRREGAVGAGGVEVQVDAHEVGNIASRAHPAKRGAARRRR